MPWSIIFLIAFGLWIGMAYSHTSGWKASITITSGAVSFPLTFGGDPNATDGYDAGLDIAAAPPGMTYYAYFETAQFPNYLSTDIRAWIAPYNTNIDWTLKVVSATGKTSTISWTSADLPVEGSFTLAGANGPVDMRIQNSATFTGDKTITIQYRPAITKKWSLPLNINGDGVISTLTFGGDPAATAGFDAGLDTLAAPPGMTYYAYFGIPEFPNYLSTDLRAWISPFQTDIDWTLKIVNATGKTTTITWISANLPLEGTFMLEGVESPINMRNQNSAVFTGDKTLLIKYRSSVIAITSPNGGEKWAFGSIQTITWTSVNFTGSVKIEYSTNGGTSWISPPIVGSTANDGSQPWIIPNTPSATCKVRISNPVDGIPSDISDNVFAIGNFVDIWPPADTTGAPNSIVNIPIFVRDVTNKDIFSLNLTVNTQPSVLTPLAAITQGTITQTWGAPTVKISGGEIQISMAGTSPLAGFGRQILLYIRYQTGSLPKTETLITIAKAAFNEGQPETIIKNGKFTIASVFNLYGHIKYYSSSLSVSQVKMSLTGQSTKNAVSDTSGSYQLGDLPEGNYVLKPSKINDVRKAITSYDASMVLRSSVGAISLSPYQLIAADVSDNGQVTSYDASLILRYCVGMIPQFPVGKDWTFIPQIFPISVTNWLTAPDSLEYKPLNSDLYNQDFHGIIYGDVSGNWPGTNVSGSSIAVGFSIENIQQTQDKKWLVPVTIRFSDVAYSGSFKLRFDESNLQFVSCSTSSFDSATLVSSVTCSEGIYCVFAANQSLLNSGIELNFIFEEKHPAAPSASDFKFIEAVIDDRVAVITGVKNQSDENQPSDWHLSQNYPNPFNAETLISYLVPKASHVKIEIYNLLGQRLRVLVDEEKKPGSYRVIWNGLDNQDRAVGSGIYVCRMRGNEFTAIKKMVLAR